MLFAPGSRPAAADVERLLEATLPGRPQIARISHRPLANDGWLELLASGLTFDLRGLSPAEGASVPLFRHGFGLAPGQQSLECEAVALEPSVHVASGAAMVPVVRVLAGIAEVLCGLDTVCAVCWNPAASWMESGYFVRLVRSWLAGGAFPGLGLTGIERTGDGGIETDGLAFFTGQELRVEPLAGEAPADTVKLAVRTIDLLVRHGHVDSSYNLTGPAGEGLQIVPDPGGRLLRLWRTD